MLFQETRVRGAYLIDLEPHADERGFFARTWCQREFEAHGLETRLVQCSVSYNRATGTLRGLHYSAPPYEEVKIVRCTSGAIFDVIVDLRRASPTYLIHDSATLSAENRRMFYIPKGVAHGFQTLEDDTEIFYQMSEFFDPASQRGVRWDDPSFGVAWPFTECRTMNERDRSYPDFIVQDIKRF